MSVLSDIKEKQDRLFEVMGEYVQAKDIATITRRRRTQMEDFSGQLRTLQQGSDALERLAEDLDKRITDLE